MFFDTQKKLGVEIVFGKQKIPKKFEYKNSEKNYFDGLYFKEEKESNGESYINYIFMCKEELYITSKIYSIENNDYSYEILTRYKNKTKGEICSFDTIATKTNIIKFLAKQLGININEKNYKYFIMYFNDFININNEEIKVKKAISTLGWHDNEFAQYSEKVTFDYTKDKNGILRRLIYNTKPSGDLEEWKSIIKRYESKSFDYIMGTSFVSPLLVKLGRRTYQNIVFGESENGKTFVGHCALSVWGRPSVLKIGSSDTQNTIMEKAYLYQNIFMLLDDYYKKGNDKKSLDLYLIANEKNRGRLNKDSQLTKEKSWRLNCLITAETRLTEENSQKGEYNRSLEFENKFINDKDQAIKDYSLLEENYSEAGKTFINEIKKYDIEVLKEKLKEIENKLQKDFADKKLNNHILSVACSCLGIYLYKSIIFNQDDKFNYSVECGKEILNKLPDIEATNQQNKVLDIMYSFYEINQNRFINGNNIPKNEILGEVKNNEIKFIVAPLKKYIEGLGFNFLKNKDYLLKDGKIKYKNSRINGLQGKRIILPFNSEIKEKEKIKVDNEQLIYQAIKTLSIDRQEKVIKNLIKMLEEQKKFKKKINQGEIVSKLDICKTLHTSNFIKTKVLDKNFVSTKNVKIDLNTNDTNIGVDIFINDKNKVYIPNFRDKEVKETALCMINDFKLKEGMSYKELISFMERENNHNKKDTTRENKYLFK